MTRPTPRRQRIGAAASLAERVRVDRTADALEVDTSTSFEISRRRVFFDEIVLVLLHRRRFHPLLVLVAVFLLLACVGAVLAKEYWVLIPLVVLLACVLLGPPAWTVTAYGRRTFARMRYGLRKGKARAIYDEICRRAAEAQAELAARLETERQAAAQAAEPVAEPGPLPRPVAGLPDPPDGGGLS
ncbi:MAG TPA: hypothetical protein VGE98_09705 [Thermoanaerobaculia bacterium]